LISPKNRLQQSSTKVVIPSDQRESRNLQLLFVSIAFRLNEETTSSSKRETAKTKRSHCKGSPKSLVNPSARNFLPTLSFHNQKTPPTFAANYARPAHNESCKAGHLDHVPMTKIDTDHRPLVTEDRPISETGPPRLAKSNHHRALQLTSTSTRH
jgi:hypothetical protein